jgi:hypothetical protein
MEVVQIIPILCITMAASGLHVGDVDRLLEAT